MDFEEFLNVVKDRLPEFLLQYDIEDIHMDTVNKNNGIKYTGMAVIVRGEQISPNIYMDYYYNLYLNGTNLDKLLVMISEEYKRSRETMLSIDFQHIDDMDIKKHIFLKLVSYEKNKDMLCECPFIKYHDLAITFRILVKMDENGISSALLRSKELSKLCMDIDGLYELARENTRILFPPVLQRLDEILTEKFPEVGELPRDANLYVLTNNLGINGAANLLFEDILWEFAKDHGSFYILPSSIHEVLLFPGTGNENKNELEDMVKEVNQFVVSQTEFLSDKVYFYNAVTRQIVA